jgi:AraC-like DNA-binding protein
MVSGRRLPRVALGLNANRSGEIQRYIKGDFNYYALRPGFACRVDNGVVEAPFIEVSNMPNWQLMLQFRLKSPSAVRYEEGERHQRLAPHFAVILMLPGSSKQETFEREQQDRVITLHCGREFLQPILNKIEPPLPGWLDSFLEGKANNQHSSHRLSAAMRSAANSILTAEPNGFLFEVILRAKCEELLWHGLLALCNESDQEAAIAGLSHAESQKINLVRERIILNFPEVPPLAQLASELKLSPWKLNRGFKAVHGMTASQYVVELRMQRARELLNEDQLSIQDIAIEVGYDYLTNFSKAFKQHSGLSPRDFRESL